jgi:hypothetical protein
MKRAGFYTGPLIQLLLLLALGMCRVGLLVRCLRMLLRTRRVLLALGMVALAVMFGSGTMRLGGVLVVFGCLVMLVFGHEILVVFSSQSGRTRDVRQRSSNRPAGTEIDFAMEAAFRPKVGPSARKGNFK